MMLYCTLDDAYGYDPTTFIHREQNVVEPKVQTYTCYDFREHIQSCSHCANVLAETRNQFYKQDDNSNMIILFLILLLIWSMTSKN